MKTIKSTRMYQKLRRFRKMTYFKGMCLFKYGRAPRVVDAWPEPGLEIGRDYHSQFGQDLYVLQKIFPRTAKGVFVDVGANHPVALSNTYLLERQGWSGIAFEPQLELCGMWKERRKAKCLPYVLGSEDMTVRFVECSEDVLSGVSGFAEAKIESRRAGSFKVVEKEQKRLDALLLQNGIAAVDVLSLDVEGYEMNVLEGIDFTKIAIACIVLENDSARYGDFKIRDYLHARGYRLHTRLFGDDIFVRR